MKTALLVLLIAAPVLLTTLPPAAAEPRDYFVSYVGNPLLVPRVVGPNFGFEPGIGGAVFAGHEHDTNATVVVTDDVNGAIPAMMCQDLNNNFACDAFPGGGDTYACSLTGTFTDFPIKNSTSSSRNATTVYIALNGFRLEVCNANGRATTGTIGLTYTT